MEQSFKDDNFYIGEDDFQEKMKTEVEPFVAEFTDGYLLTDDCTKIHYYYKINPAEKGAVVMSHGFCEFFAKFYETAYYFYNSGYSVFFIQHRGHERSGRVATDPDMVYVKSYDEYVSDMHQFITEVVEEKSITKNLLLWAHSMGGLIGSLYLEDYPDIFKAAVLSSPMHRVNCGSMPGWAVKAMMVLAPLFGMNMKYGPGQHKMTDKYDPEHSSEMSVARYDYYRRVRLEDESCTTYGGCYAWIIASLKATEKCMKNAGKVVTPYLLCEAENDTMVINPGHDDFLRLTGTDNRIIYKGSKHEIYAATDEIRKKYYKDVLGYFEQYAVI